MHWWITWNKIHKSKLNTNNRSGWKIRQFQPGTSVLLVSSRSHWRPILDSLVQVNRIRWIVGWLCQLCRQRSWVSNWSNRWSLVKMGYAATHLAWVLPRTLPLLGDIICSPSRRLQCHKMWSQAHVTPELAQTPQFLQQSLHLWHVRRNKLHTNNHIPHNSNIKSMDWLFTPSSRRRLPLQTPGIRQRARVAAWLVRKALWLPEIPTWESYCSGGPSRWGRQCRDGQTKL